MASPFESVGKVIIALVMLAMGLAGLAMTVCGVLFIGSGGGILAIAAIVVGVLLTWGAVRWSGIGESSRPSADSPPSVPGP